MQNLPRSWPVFPKIAFSLIWWANVKSSNKPGYVSNSYTDSPTLFSKSFFETSKFLVGFEIGKFSRGALLSSQTSQSKAQKFQKATTHF